MPTWPPPRKRTPPLFPDMLDSKDEEIRKLRGLLAEALKWIPNNDWPGNPYRRIREALSDGR